MAKSARKTLRSAAELVAAGLVPGDALPALEQVAARYAVSLTPAMADLIDPADPHDPIARQFLPDPAELATQPQESPDPIGDDAHSPLEGIVHRYPDRVLLKLVHICPVYCRFCFRREMVGPGRRRARAGDARCGARLHPHASQKSGDHPHRRHPLVLSPRRLRAVMRALAAMAHVKIVRVHTRVPVADPARITPELVRALKASGKATYVVLHANHPRELTQRAGAACARLIDAGIPMLSQSVLIRGVNDDAATLAALMRTLVECRIKPYYLHQGDLAPGTSHLRTRIAEAGAMRAQRAAVRPLPADLRLDIRAVTASRRSGRTISPMSPGPVCRLLTRISRAPPLSAGVKADCRTPRRTTADRVMFSPPHIAPMQPSIRRVAPPCSIRWPGRVWPRSLS
jgi:lysine 2,3-aminomutase